MRTLLVLCSAMFLVVNACGAQEEAPPTPTEEVQLPPEQEYEISRASDGWFATRVSGITINEGSTLERESIVLNVPSSPVRVHGAQVTFSYEDRRFRYEVSTQLEASVLVTALEVRHVLFDIFGDHMHNLSNTEAVDMISGEQALDGVWNMFQENDLSEHLTTVTYVARARLEDGSVWSADMVAIAAALQSLDLDREIEDGGT